MRADAQARTADGQFDAELPVTIAWTLPQSPDAREATSTEVRLLHEGGTVPQTRSSVEAMFPHLAVDLSAYEQLLLSFGAIYTLGQDAASGDAGSVRGILTLVGSNPAPACTDEEFEALEAGRPSRDCTGREDTTLSGGNWTAL